MLALVFLAGPVVGAFFAGAFFATDFLTGVFFAAVFLPTVFVGSAGLVAVDFFAGGAFFAVFLAAAFWAGAFLAGAFLAGAFFAAFLGGGALFDVVFFAEAVEDFLATDAVTRFAAAAVLLASLPAVLRAIRASPLLDR